MIGQTKMQKNYKANLSRTGGGKYVFFLKMKFKANFALNKTFLFFV
jgi:hypothetical protein